MSNIGNRVNAQLTKLFLTPEEVRVQQKIDEDNVLIVNHIALVIAIVESFNLVAFGISQINKGLNAPLIRSLVQVAFCIIACLTAYYYTRKFRNNKDIPVPHRFAVGLIIGFYLALSAWGMIVDWNHFDAGEQMLTFFIVQLCFVCFIVIRPIITVVMMGAVFFVFDFVLIRKGMGAAPTMNAIVFAIISIIVAIIRYQGAVKEKQNMLELTDLNLVLKESALFDELTGLKNRRALRNDFENFKGHILFATMADIDYFKSYNDTYGHAAGDKVLQKVAETLKQSFPVGRIYRYGGDEFLIIMSDMNKSEHEARLKDWNKRVDNLYLEGPNVRIRCSSGSAMGTPETEENIRSLIQEADMGLYVVKEQRKKMMQQFTAR